MPNEPWWGWVLLGRLHPLIVHFPIGLIVAGALHELVRWLRRRPVPSDVGSFCLVLGLVSGALAVWLGTLNASHQSITGDSARILEWHRYAGWALLVVGAAAFLAGRVARSRPGAPAASVYTGLVAVAALCVGVSGHFGGQLVYGSTYITSVLPWNGGSDTASPSVAESVSPEPTVTPAPPALPALETAPAPRSEPVVPAPAAEARAVTSSGPAEQRPAAVDAAPPETGPRVPPVVVSAEPSPGPTVPTAFAAASGRVDFVRDVRPILEQTCVECHGADKVKARLRMDSIAALQQGGKSGPLVVPGDPETSLMMRRVLGLDDEDQMPLDNDPLTPAQLEILRRWIAEGAHYTSRPGTESQP